MIEKLQTGLKDLRDAFQGDGVDLQLTGWNNGIAEVTLVFDDNVCEECIVPNEIIRMMVENALKEQVNDLRVVKIIDPRENERKI
jgi:Fe-S cluster biogenesis protein NfuA